MKSIEKQIHEAIAQLNIKAVQLNPVERKDALHKMLVTFASTKDFVQPIWENFKEDTCSLQSHLAWKYVGEMEFRGVQEPFLLFYEQTGELGAFSVERPSMLSAILGECDPFMYYITNDAAEFLLCENDHDFLIAAGKAKQWLLEYVRVHLMQSLDEEIVNYNLPGLER